MDAETKKLYGLKAEVMQAVAQPVRLAIIDFLREGEQCVCDIAAHVEAERSNVSRHLALMLKAGILESRKEGLRVMYWLRAPCILNFLECVVQVLRERYESDRTALSRV